MTRLYIVDDHAVLRSGLRLLLTQEADLEIVGEAANGRELLEMLPNVPADLVLLDVQMPVLDGLATAIRLRAEYPRIRILMLSMVDQIVVVGQAMTAGAHGYLLKNAERPEILAAIQIVMSGKRFLCSEIGLSLLDTLLTVSAPSPAVPEPAATPLSRREQEILQLVADGLTTQQIADQLFTSKRTIETHRQNILEKTGVKNTAALIRYAMVQGWLAAD